MSKGKAVIITCVIIFFLAAVFLALGLGITIGSACRAPTPSSGSKKIITRLEEVCQLRVNAGRWRR